MAKGVKLLKNGVRIEFQYKNQWCREFVHLGRPPTSQDIKYFTNKRSEILAKIARGAFDYKKEFPQSSNLDDFSDTPNTPIKFLLDGFLDEARDSVEFSTYNGYRKIVDQLKQQFGEIGIADLTAYDLKKYVKTQTCTDKTLRNKLSPLRMVLEEALDDQLIKSNPFNELPKLSNIRKKRKNISRGNNKIDPFSPDEMRELAKAMPEYLANQWWAIYWTGMRTSEFIALDWGDVDFHNRRIYINSAVVLGEEKDRTKTEAGTREIMMLDGAYRALKAIRESNQFRQGKVFLSPDELPWTGDQQVRRRGWMPFFSKCEVRYRRPYNLRHSYASLMLTLGEDIELISQQMGHTNSVLFRQTYATIIKDLRRDFGQKANDFFRTLTAP